MIAERWGSLAVADHTSTRDLVANILLYDRLIVPVMSNQHDRDERAYWLKKEWNPDLQLKRVEQLRGLAVPRPWDRSRREAFTTRFAELQNERLDVADVDALALATTRHILTMEPVTEKLPGVERVDVLAAYNSASAIGNDFVIGEAKDDLQAQAILLTRRLAIPDYEDEEKALACAIELSRDEGFREKRSSLFDWQANAITQKWSPTEAVERIASMTDNYNDAVKNAAGTVRWKLAFLVCGIGLGFATGGVAAAAGAAALSSIQFLMLDRKPALEPGSARPAAMFHDMKEKLGVRLAS
jgi:hypothetical protein